MDNRNRALAPFFILAAAILWGTAGTSQAFAPEGATPIVLSAVRMTIGGVSLFLLALITGSFKTNNKWSIHLVLFSSAALAAFNLFFFSSLARTGVAVGTVVAIGSAPVFAGLLSWLVRRNKPSKMWMIATLLAVIGCSMLFLNQKDVVVDAMGVFFALCAGLSYSSYTVFSKQLLEQQKTFAVLSVVFLFSALVLVILSAGQNYDWIFTSRGTMVSLHLGLVTVALAYVLFSKGLLNTSAATAVSLTLAEPLTAAFLGVIVLKEKIGMQSLLGIALMILGLIILMRGEPKTDITYIEV